MMGALVYHDHLTLAAQNVFGKLVLGRAVMRWLSSRRGAAHFDHSRT